MGGPAADLIDLTSVAGLDTFAQAQMMTESGADIIIELSHGNSITLQNATIAALQETSFIF